MHGRVDESTTVSAMVGTTSAASCHAAIRKQGNRSRQAKVKEYIQDSIAQDTNVAVWASMHGFASYMPMYWHVHQP